MRRFARPLLVLAVAVLAAALLAACSSGAGNTPTPSAATPSAETTAAAGAGNSGGGNGSGGGGGANRDQNGTGGGGGAAVSPTRSGTALFKVTQGGKLVKQWTLEALQAAVPATSITLDGDRQNGPLLLDVLKASGVTSWTKGEVLGSGPGRAFDVALPIDASQVDQTWIVDITKRGTVKLAAQNLPREQWVLDITEIKLQ